MKRLALATAAKLPTLNDDDRLTTRAREIAYAEGRRLLDRTAQSKVWFERASKSMP